MREKTLFIGNGLNRTLESGLSWAQLMDEIGSDISEDAEVPFPLVFEEIAAKNGASIGRRKSDTYKELKNELAQAIDGMNLEPGYAHLCFRDLPFSHFVTTNYDDVFEKMFPDKKDSEVKVGSSRNVLKPTSRSGTKDFYHAHGITKWKNTLCLGHEHYASLIAKIRGELYPPRKGEGADTSDNDYLERLIKGAASSGIWPEYLFTNDVAIVGLELDYCEVDLWWLLSLRAACFAACHNLNEYDNKIIYFEPVIKGGLDNEHDSKRAKQRKNGKEAILKALSVEVRKVRSESYKDAYGKIAKMLKKEWAK